MTTARPCWYVYLLECRDGTFYTGITTDPRRRLAEHNRGARGARYTRARRPVRLVYREPAPSRAAAARREFALRRLPRSEKMRLAAAGGVRASRYRVFTSAAGRA